MTHAIRFSQLPLPTLMGIVNITPNSFSDTGRHFDPVVAGEHVKTLAGRGAMILDLGAEASSFFRAGVAPVDVHEQLRRLLPVLMQFPVPRNFHLSIDTRSAEVARQAIELGAEIINDISGGTQDPAMLKVVAKAKASIILMHIGPTFPDNPLQDDPDILATVRGYLAGRVAAARRAGIPHEHIAIDPGLGFGKTPHDNWMLALRAQELQAALKVPVVLGASRKRFLETTPPAELLPLERWRQILAAHASLAAAHPRDPATAAMTQLAIENQIPIHRLHNPDCLPLRR